MFPGAFVVSIALAEERLIQVTKKEWQAFLLGGLLVAEIAFAVTRHLRASYSALLLIALLVIVIGLDRNREKKADAAREP
jgi:hypothetical protein